jgi:hypothetical protein
MERWTFDSQHTNMPANGRPDNLYEPVAHDGGERGRNWTGYTRTRSVYTEAFLYPYRALAVFGLLAGIGIAGTRAGRRRTSGASRPLRFSRNATAVASASAFGRR